MVQKGWKPVDLLEYLGFILASKRGPEENVPGPLRTFQAAKQRKSPEIRRFRDFPRWQGQKDLNGPLAVPEKPCAGGARLCFSTAAPRAPRCIRPRRRSGRAPGTLRVPRVHHISLCQARRRPCGRRLAWQGQKDLNPRHSVLETDALPTELYPYI